VAIRALLGLNACFLRVGYGSWHGAEDSTLGWLWIDGLRVLFEEFDFRSTQCSGTRKIGDAPIVSTLTVSQYGRSRVDWGHWIEYFSISTTHHHHDACQASQKHENRGQNTEAMHTMKDPKLKLRKAAGDFNLWRSTFQIRVTGKKPCNLSHETSVPANHLEWNTDRINGLRRNPRSRIQDNNTQNIPTVPRRSWPERQFLCWLTKYSCLNRYSKRNRSLPNFLSWSQITHTNQALNFS